MFFVGGLVLLFETFVSLPATTKLLIAAPSAAALILLWFYAADEVDLEESAATLPGWNLLDIRPFFNSRFEFLNAAFIRAGHAVFQFKLLQHTVVAVSGAEGRRDFLMSRGLDINEGFKLLSGAIPMLPGVTSDLQARRIATIHKRLGATQSSEHLSLIPRILADGERIMGFWGKSGTIDIFDSLPKIFFQTSVRCLSATELANDEGTVARLKELYDQLDAATTPASVLLPWFPSPSMVSKLLATKRIYDIVNGVVTKRVQEDISQDDTLQILIDNSDDRLVMVGFIMGLLVAGARSTGTTASWLITFLAGHPEWRSKVRAEAEALLQNHTNCMSGDSLSSTLATIPLQAWETEMPVFDSVIRETLRLAQPHTAMRRNMGPDTYVGGAKVPSGSYVVYPFSDVHLNSDLYPDPWRFDPGRPEPKAPHSWIGWGGGTTICLGQRLARLSLKLVTALMLLELDFDLVDRRTGRLPQPLPQPNWNDALTCKPPQDPSTFISKSLQVYMVLYSGSGRSWTDDKIQAFLKDITKGNLGARSIDLPALPVDAKSAQKLSNELWRTLLLPQTPSEHRPILRKITQRLAMQDTSEAPGVLPSSFLLRGVTTRRVRIGNIGDVYFGEYAGECVALKLFSMGFGSQEERMRTKKRFYRETIACSNLTHPNILSIYGVVKLTLPLNEMSLCIVMPYIRRGSVRSLVSQESEGAKSELPLIKWLYKLYEIALGLKYLHDEDPGIVHGDLHPGNVLIDDGGNAMISDFGHGILSEATPGGTGSTSKHEGGEFRFRAPELTSLHNASMTGVRPTRESDIFAFACVCFELYAKHPPYHLENNPAIVAQRYASDKRPTLPPGMPQMIQNLTNNCWVKTPLARAFVSTVVDTLSRLVPRNSRTPTSPPQSPSSSSSSNESVQSSTSSTMEVILDPTTCTQQVDDSWGNLSVAADNWSGKAIKAYRDCSDIRKTHARENSVNTCRRIVENTRRAKEWWIALQHHEYFLAHGHDLSRVIWAWVFQLVYYKIPEDPTIAPQGLSHMEKALSVDKDEDIQLVILLSKTCRYGTRWERAVSSDGYCCRCPGKHLLTSEEIDEYRVKFGLEGIHEKVAKVRRKLIEIILLMKSLMMLLERPRWRKLYGSDSQEYAVSDELKAGAMFLGLMVDLVDTTFEDFAQFDWLPIPGSSFVGEVLKLPNFEDLTLDIKSSFPLWYGMHAI
ncbi:hypothetical protein EIP91_006022 [Steccherinum ochraceum]|uniref:Protein kinase domain-containing protein n=1 Tax=Steccherinum ochraceum TaxID=92696 RepID=A0A4R0R8W8_9APHY|nr:hypothetical protein EIP91_006022 [Steccherinum ochraceum]